MNTTPVNKPPFSRKALPAQERRPKVAELLLAGRTQREIATELKISLGTVANDAKAIRAAWRQQATEIIDEAFERDLLRIEVLIASIWRMAIGTERGADGQLVKDSNGNTKGPNLWAIDRLVVLLGRKASMLGYDAPARVVIKDLRSLAAEEGIDAADVLAEAERILTAAR